MAQSAAAKPNVAGQLRREVGLTSLMFISLGSIIGSGWLLGALTAAKLAGPASLLSWILGGSIVALLALIHAELGSAYPMSGGTARFPHIVFGSIPGFTAGWAGWLQAVSIAPIEVEAALSYLNNKWNGLITADTGVLTQRGLGVAVLLMLVFTVVNIMGVRWLAESNRITVVWKIAIPVLTVIVLLFVSFHTGNFSAGGGFAPFGAHGVFAALPAGVVFALQGFEQAIQMGGESRDPARDMPRAVIGAMIIGTLIYLLLEVAFVGALDPGNLSKGWANPIGKGDFGPYATLATGLGLGWLATLLYVDAFISPAGTGLVYIGTSSRLSYALGRNQYLPGVVDRVSKRGVPFFSIILAFIVGLIFFLPFPSWQSLVGLVTSATFIMYGFAPVALGALRKSDPDRVRPYRLPAAGVLAPLGFAAADLTIYWSGWEVVWKLSVAMLIGLLLFAISMAFRKPDERPLVDWRASSWLLPWLGGLALITFLGQYGGRAVIPEWIDLLVVVAVSVVVYYLAVALSLPASTVARLVAREELDQAQEPELKVAG